MRVLQQMSNPVHFGVITCTCVDSGRTWLVTGTQGGILTLWDLRFGLRLRSWRVGTSSGSQTSMCIHQCVIHPTAGKRTLVVVSITPRPLSSQPSSVDNAKALIEVWDISKPALVESFATREVSDPHHGLPSLTPTFTPELETSVQPEMTTPAEAIVAFVRARKPGRGGRTSSPPESSRVDTQDNSSADAETRTLRGAAIEDVDGVFMHDPDGESQSRASARRARDIRALIGGVNFGTPGNRINRLFTGDAYGDVDPRPAEEKTGYIITGSADRRITYWDLSGKIERSVVLSGLEPGTEQPVFRQVNILTLVKYSTYATLQNRTRFDRYRHLAHGKQLAWLWPSSRSTD
jgi:phosphoinositide-3-kinase, regulatory subunit 4